MREIKFRAFDPSTNDMFELGVLELDSNRGHDYYNFYEGYSGVTVYFDPKHGEAQKSALMQYTGIKDKNEVEIYEGDIVKTGTDKLMVIGWSERFASFVIMRDGWAFQHWFGEAMEGKDCEVVGNIYQHKELLNQQ